VEFSAGHHFFIGTFSFVHLLLVGFSGPQPAPRNLFFADFFPVMQHQDFI
jgi:hypothetical protein